MKQNQISCSNQANYRKQASSSNQANYRKQISSSNQANYRKRTSSSNQANHRRQISSSNQANYGKRTGYSKLRKKIWYIIVGMGVFLLLLTGMQYAKRLRLQQEIADKIVRFHVLANSDTEADQNLKLAVRDTVGAKMSTLLSGADSREECEAIINTQMDEIIATAKQVVQEEGYDYGVQAFLSNADFPVKTYGNYTFPAGRYKALEVVIGAGAGHNWWCVMYPNMCFFNSVYEVVDEEAEESLRQVLTAEEYEAVMENGNYEVKWKWLR